MFGNRLVSPDLQKSKGQRCFSQETVDLTRQDLLDEAVIHFGSSLARMQGPWGSEVVVPLWGHLGQGILDATHPEILALLIS